MTEIMRRVDHFSASPRVVQACILIMILCVTLFLGVSIYVVIKVQEEAEHLRVSICGIAETYTSAPGTPLTAKGEALQRAFDNARSKEGADCTPQLDDGR